MITAAFWDVSRFLETCGRHHGDASRLRPCFHAEQSTWDHQESAGGTNDKRSSRDDFSNVIFLREGDGCHRGLLMRLF
jgi:hypothetical protein